jgi:cob(I)alamin adenosyltransferase
MKIYTRKGDTGQTSLLGGSRVSKSGIRIEAYGTVDELNAYIGWVRDLSARDEQKETLIEIQDRLFTMGSHLAADPEKTNLRLPALSETDVTFLEKQIDAMNEELPEMKSFVLPGGHPAVSCCHVARCVCRRAERAVVHLSEHHNVDPLILKYLNRLSDFLFVLSRMLAKNYAVIEVPWKPRNDQE